MQKEQSVAEQEQLAERQKLEQEERVKLVVHKVRLPNGATFTRLKPVTQS